MNWKRVIDGPVQLLDWPNPTHLSLRKINVNNNRSKKNMIFSKNKFLAKNMIFRNNTYELQLL